MSTVGQFFLGVIGVGLVIGLLDFGITLIINLLAGEDMSGSLSLLTWVPILSMLVIGGLLILQWLEDMLAALRSQKMLVGMAAVTIAGLMAVYYVLQGSSLGFYVIAAISGEFNSALDLLVSGILVLLIGGTLWLLGELEAGGTSGIIYLGVLSLTTIYYVVMGNIRALQVIDWQMTLRRRSSA